MDTIINFVTSFTLFGMWWAFSLATVVWIFTLFAAEGEENGSIAFVTSGIFFGLIYYDGKIDILSIFSWMNILSYIGIGFVYSLIKTFFYAKNGGNKSQLKEHVFRWWFLWPISFLYWCFSDLIRNLYDLIYNKISILYDEIFEFATKDKEKEEEDLEN